MTQAALYVRVSTNDQELEGQERDLRLFAGRMDLIIDAVYKEKITASGKQDRPEYNRLLRDAADPDRSWSYLLLWSLDRFSRAEKFTDAINAVLDLEEQGIRFLFLKEPAVLNTPADGTESFARDVLLAILPVVAKYEAARRADRTRLAMAELKSGRRKTRSGKPVGRPVRVTEEKAEAIDRLRAKGLAWADVARKVGLPKGTCRAVHSERKRGRWKSRALETVKPAAESSIATDGPVDST
jgi:DNA invertase Pin-like site-specific DNA recombinase